MQMTILLHSQKEKKAIHSVPLISPCNCNLNIIYDIQILYMMPKIFCFIKDTEGPKQYVISYRNIDFFHLY